MGGHARAAVATVSAVWSIIDAAVVTFGNWIERHALRRIGVAAPLAMVGIGIGIVALTIEEASHHDGRWVVVTSDGIIVARP